MATTALHELETEIIRFLGDNPEHAVKYISSLKASDFTFEHTREVFDAISEYTMNGKKYDRTIILQDIHTDQASEILDLPSEIDEEEVKEYIKKLKNTSHKRSIREHIQHTAMDLKKRTTAREIAGKNIDFYRGLLDNTAVGDEAAISLASFVEEHKRIVEEVRSGETIGVTTGLEDIDAYILGGLKGGDLVLIGARPSVGKTSLSLGMAYSAAKAGHKVLFFSVEMKMKDIFDRLLAFHSGKSVTEIVRGEVDLSKYYEEVAALDLRVIESPSVTSQDVMSLSTREKYVNGVDLVVVDYLQYLADNLKGGNEAVRIGRISRNLKTLAGQLDVPVISPVQLNRKSEYRGGESKGIPTLADLRDSGNLEQDADIVMLLSRDINDTSGVTRLQIAKNRKGPTGTFMMKFDSKTTMFSEDEITKDDDIEV